MNRAIVALVGIVFAGCSEPTPAKSADDGDAGDDGSSLDAAVMTDAGCLAAWQRIDAAKKCLGPGVVTAALCVTEPATHKGLYKLCAFGPSHEAYFKEVSQPLRADASGWTFAPQWLAELLGLPASTGDDAAACDIVLASSARPPLPDCL